MKQLCYYLCLLCGLMCSCNHNNDPQPETLLPIQEFFTPMGMWLDKNDPDAEFFKEISGKLFVVNSAEELPDDRLGFPEAYKKADFKHYTLLIYYRLLFWAPDSYRYRYIRMNLKKEYNWFIEMHVGADEVPYPDMRCINRFAIMVNKIPESWEVSASFGLNDYNWSWDE